MNNNDSSREVNRPLQQMHLGGTSPGSSTTPSELTFDNVSERGEQERNLNYAKQYFRKYGYGSQLPPDIQGILSKHLNPKVEIERRDYHNFAQHLKFDNTFINNLKGKEDPTKIILENCTDKRASTIALVLFEMKRMDVLSSIVKHGMETNPEFIVIQRQLSARGSSVEETGDDSSNITWPSFDDDSGVYPMNECSISWPGAGRARQETFHAAVTRTPSEQESLASTEDAIGENYPDKESKAFWNSIKGPATYKLWPEFEEAVNRDLRLDIEKGVVKKFVCHSLKVDFGKREQSSVFFHDFRKMVNCFGPMKPGPDGCLEKMNDLMSKSHSLKEGKSWFGGHMTQDDAEEKLRNEKQGVFLVRYSESIDGFSLGVRTGKSGVQHYRIEVDPEANHQLKFGAMTFSSLSEFVKYYRDNPLEPDERDLLSAACKDLPLNAMFKGYAKPKVQSSSSVGAQASGTRSKRGRGRGRGIRKNLQKQNCTSED